MRPEAPGVWAMDSMPNFAIIGNCRLGNGQGNGRNPYPGRPPITGLMVVSSPQSNVIT